MGVGDMMLGGLVAGWEYAGKTGGKRGIVGGIIGSVVNGGGGGVVSVG